MGIIAGSYEFPLLDLRSNHQFYLIVFSLTRLYLHIPNLYQFGDHDHMWVIPKFSRSNSSLTFIITTIEEDPLIQTKYLPPTLGRSASRCKEWEKDRPVIGFLDQEKMDEISNSVLPPVIIAIIANDFVSGVLMDEGSSWNLFYFKKIQNLVWGDKN